MSEVFIVFISKHSQACRAIKQQLDYISPHFNTRVVDIDNINIRNLSNILMDEVDVDHESLEFYLLSAKDLSNDP